MKKILIFCFLISSILANIYGQINQSVTTNYSYGKSDTTSTFSINKVEIDKAIELMISKFGNPVTKKAGNVVWQKINIQGVGDELTMKLLDGIFSFDDYTYMTFSDYKDKSERLSNLTKSRVRNCTLEILNNYGLNIIDEKNEVEIIQRIFNELFTGLN